MRKQLLYPFFAFVLVLMLLIPVISMASGREWGYVKVIGYKDPLCNGDRKFAPLAVYHNLGNAGDRELYLEYHYSKYNTYTRVWGVRFVDKNHRRTSVSDHVDIVFPYPSIWSADQNTYWKWTNDYASRKDWDMVFGRAYFDETGSNYSAATDDTRDKTITSYTQRGMVFYFNNNETRNIYPKYNFGFSICAYDIMKYNPGTSNGYAGIRIRIVDKPIREKYYDWETDTYISYDPFYKQHLSLINSK